MRRDGQCLSAIQSEKNKYLHLVEKSKDLFGRTLVSLSQPHPEVTHLHDKAEENLFFFCKLKRKKIINSILDIHRSSFGCGDVSMKWLCVSGTLYFL